MADILFGVCKPGVRYNEERTSPAYIQRNLQANLQLLHQPECVNVGYKSYIVSTNPNLAPEKGLDKMHSSFIDGCSC